MVKSKIISAVFKDSKGRVVLLQWPNIPLYGWIVFKLVSMFVSHGRLKDGFGQLSTAFLFAWAFIETTHGVNYFRKLLGCIVLVAVIMGLFKM